MTCACGNSYIVKSGDTLFLIAQQQLSDGNRWKEITKPNCTPFTEEEARRLQPGDEVCLPKGSNGETINLEATFYDVETTGCSFPASGVFGITLRAALEGRFEPRCPNTGENVPRVQCAVAPSQIPLRTNFTLVLWDNSQVRAEALDVGSTILPGKIDILVDTVEEALNLGRKPVKVIL
ncbi:LysM peptidoglycan-binding domain-containing protein [Scytonema sp. PCC 10023]|uniref:LysM peptidoglycan-binding domain-containing protein n=1 Tax=Scytonema sp. PCC 10023 TaxID=1680591 RepID=UPI0039C6EC21